MERKQCFSQGSCIRQCSVGSWLQTFGRNVFPRVHSFMEGCYFKCAVRGQSCSSKGSSLKRFEMSFRLSGDFFDRDQILQFLTWPCLLRETDLCVLLGHWEPELPENQPVPRGTSVRVGRCFGCPFSVFQIDLSLGGSVDL